jgi:hypothetical protein
VTTRKKRKKYNRKHPDHSCSERFHTNNRLKRVHLFGEAVLFFTSGGWIGLRMKGAPFHLLVGFSPEGMTVHKTIEETGEHIPIANIPNETLSRGLNEFYSEILRYEIDPTASKYKHWTVLIPHTSPDTPIARKVILDQDSREPSVTFEPLVKMGQLRALHTLHEVIPMPKVAGRRFKWAHAYPTRNWRKFSNRTLRWLYGWNGHYYMITDRKRNTLQQAIFNITENSDRV